MMTALRRLLGSRKAWQVWSGTWANFTLQASAVLSQMSETMPPAQRNVITLVSVLMGLCFQAAGIVSAVLTALKDYTEASAELNAAVDRKLSNPRPAGDT